MRGSPEGLWTLVGLESLWDSQDPLSYQPPQGTAPRSIASRSRSSTPSLGEGEYVIKCQSLSTGRARKQL
jgi:hypothetical protein